MILIRVGGETRSLWKLLVTARLWRCVVEDGQGTQTSVTRLLFKIRIGYVPDQLSREIPLLVALWWLLVAICAICALYRVYVV